MHTFESSPFSIWRIIPELSVLLTDVLLLVLAIFFSRRQSLLDRLSYLLCMVVSCFALCWSVYKLTTPRYTMWDSFYINDSLVRIWDAVACLIYMISLTYATVFLKDSQNRSDFYPLSLMVLLGSLVMSSSNHFLSLYLGLEITSIATYTMVTFDRDIPESNEAAIKYFVLGAIASVIFLLGVSYSYGVLGDAYLHNAQLIKDSVFLNYSLLVVSVLLMFSSACFKLGVFPFHAWLPDVYAGASEVSLPFLMALAKVGAAIFAVKILFHGFSVLHSVWHPVLPAIALMTIIFGNVVAVSQNNIRKILAFSSIAQMGFVLLAFFSSYYSPSYQSVINLNFYPAFLFFIFSYSLSVLAAVFFCIFVRKDSAPVKYLSDLSGIFHSNPFLSSMACLAFLSLAGIPPLLGFWAKFFVVNQLVITGHEVVASLSVIFSVIGVFYYLRIIKVMFFDQPQPEVSWCVTSYSSYVFLVVHCLSLLAIGVFSYPLIRIASDMVYMTGL